MNTKAQVQSVVVTSASSVRYIVLVVICLLTVISYVDRTCISVSGPFLASDLGLSSVQMGFVYGAFILSYGLFAVPGGLLGDKIGGRKVITGLVLLFSLFTALTGLVHALWSLVLVRFLFGAAESSVGPNASKVLSKWLPPSKWGLAQGTMWMSGRIGGAFAPGMVVALQPFLGWRGGFWFFAAVGCIWATFFWFWFRDNPEDKSSVSEEELKTIRGTENRAHSAHTFVRMPWARLFRSRTIWTICGMYFCFSYGWHFYMTWFPTYMKTHGFTTAQMGLYGGLPFFFGAFGCLAGGVLTDYVVKKTGNVRNRRYIGCSGISADGAVYVSGVDDGERDGLRAYDFDGLVFWRPDVEFLLGGMHGRWPRICRNNHRIDEHVRKHRRIPVSGGQRFSGSVHRKLEDANHRLRHDFSGRIDAVAED